MSDRAKPRMVRVTDPETIAGIIARGKYREEIPFYTRDEADPAVLWVDTANKPGVAHD